jgi:ParB family chromosome partitioning protein
MSASPAPKARTRPGLGRGLGALIGNVPSAAVPKTAAVAAASAGPAGAAAEAAHGAAAAGPHVMRVPVAEIHRSPWQPRQTFDAEALKELADSIRAHGVIQPLLGRKTGQGGFELIAGERRLRAAIEAGLDHVPLLLMDAADRDAAEMAVIENIQREDLNVIEEAEGYRTLCDKFSLTQQEVADRVGKARASVANAVRLLDLPDDIKQLLGSSLLSAGHAKVLLGLADAKEQILLGRKCVTEGLTVRGLERLIQRRQTDRTVNPDTRTSHYDLPESHARDLADRLHRHFGTNVRLTPSITYANGKHAKGSIQIDFYGNDDLDRLLTLLGVKVE